MRTARIAIAATGAGLAAWGAWLLVGTGWSNVMAAATWLVGGVVVHDALLAPLTIALTYVGVRVLPPAARPAAAAAAVVVGSITVVAVPVLGRPGAEADNPSLLPRDYVLGWAVIVAVVVAVAALATLHAARTRRTDRLDAGAGDEAH